MAFTLTSKKIKLKHSILHAKCLRKDGTWNDSEIELDYLLRVQDNGYFQWHPDGGWYGKCRKSCVTTYEHNGVMVTTLSADTYHSFTPSIYLDDRIKNFDGRLIYNFDKCMILADATNHEDVALWLKDIYAEHRSTVQTLIAEGADGKKYMYVDTTFEKHEGVLLEVSAEAEASVFHVANDNGGMKTVEVSVLQVEAEAWGGTTGAGVGLSANLIDVNAACFDITIGIGVETGAGVHEGSVTFKFMGCGITLGRKLGISIFGCTFAIDFSRCSIM